MSAAESLAGYPDVAVRRMFTVPLLNSHGEMPAVHTISSVTRLKLGNFIRVHTVFHAKFWQRALVQAKCPAKIRRDGGLWGGRL